MTKPVVIVGAGLAGLVCARKLHQAGVPILVVDAEDRPGGRLKTDNVDGFLLDRGFQVFSSAFIHAARELNLDALHLGSFEKGAYVARAGRLALVEQQSFMDMVQDRFSRFRDKTISPHDKKLLGKFENSTGRLSIRQALAVPPISTEDYLHEFGFEEETIDRFFRPLTGAVFLDDSLQIDSRAFAFMWSMLTQGRISLPREGMQAISDQIASDIPRYLFRMGNRVSQILRDEKGRPTGVQFDTSETLDASAVVIATEADEAARLVGQPTYEGFRSGTCIYFETPVPFVDTPHLVFNGTGSGIVNHVAPVSNAVPSYAPPGKHLASATVLGIPDVSDTELAEQVKSEISSWAPSKGAYMWRFIRAYRVRYAQMAQTLGFLEHRTSNATNQDGVYWAGEFTETASIDGVVRSGIECAGMILSDREAQEAA